MQRSPIIAILRIHVRASRQVLFNSFNVPHRNSGLNGKFCTAFAAVFAEEVGGFEFFRLNGQILWCRAILILRIHIRAVVDK